MMAHALGSRVYPGKAKEIGWGTVSLTGDGRLSPLRYLEGVPVLHWHGDTFDLPAQAELLASSEVYPNQAFRVGKNILGLQFHPEVAADGLEKWLIGHTAELRQARINIPALRADNLRFAAPLEQVSGQVIATYMQQLVEVKTAS